MENNQLTALIQRQAKDTKENFIQSFVSQFIKEEQRFYSGAIVKLSKHLKK